MGFLSHPTRSVMPMRTMTQQMTNDLNPVIDPYADPVLYLRAFGIEAELVETRHTDLSSAA